MTYWERRNTASELKKVHSIFRFILIMSRVKEIRNTVFVIVFCWLVFHSYIALKNRIAAGTKVIPFTGILNKRTSLLGVAAAQHSWMLFHRDSWKFYYQSEIWIIKSKFNVALHFRRDLKIYHSSKYQNATVLTKAPQIWFESWLTSKEHVVSWHFRIYWYTKKNIKDIH